MNAYYLDASVALRALLGHSPTAAQWLDETSASETNPFISSRLLRTELTRALRREGLAVARRDHILDYIATVPVTEGILAEAEAITPHVKTLDAIHLASAMASGLDPVVVTHDDAMKATAGILGLSVHDPVVD